MNNSNGNYKVAGFILAMIACLTFIANSNNNGSEYDEYNEYGVYSEETSVNSPAEVAAKFSDKLAENAKEQATEKATEKVTEKTTEKQTEKATEKKTEKATQKQTEKTTEKSIEKTTAATVVDDRVPNYKGTSNEYKKVTYKMDTYNGDSTWTINWSINTEMYKYYSSLGRYYKEEDYKKYMFDENNASLCKTLAEFIYNEGIKKGLSEYDALMNLVAFVQSLEYQLDLDENGKLIEYPKYPIETLMDKGGDCEDLSILLASMLNELGYGTAIIHFKGHIMVGIKGGDNITGTYFEKNGSRYFVMETTAKGWKLGQLPSEYEDKTAYVYETK